MSIIYKWIVNILCSPFIHNNMYQNLHRNHVISPNFQVTPGYLQTKQNHWSLELHQRINLWQHMKSSIYSSEQEFFMQHTRCSLGPVRKSKNWFSKSDNKNGAKSSLRILPRNKFLQERNFFMRIKRENHQRLPENPREKGACQPFSFWDQVKFSTVWLNSLSPIKGG